MSQTEINPHSHLKTASEVELVYKSRIKPSERPKVITSHDVFEVLKHFYREDLIELREQFWAMYLNRANRVIACMQISSGATAGTVVDTRFVLAGAVKLNACSVIVSHNHPSGNLSPSSQDIELTKKIKTACDALDCKLLDHIILTPENTYFSFADEGMV